MIPMQQRYAYNVPGIDERVAAETKVRPAAGGQLSPALVSRCLVAIALLVGLSLGLVARHTAIIERGYELTALKEELAVLQNENKRLQLSIGQLESLERIEAAAIGKLGMAKAKEVRVVALASGAEAAESGTAAQGSAGPKPTAGKLTALFSAWYQRAAIRTTQAQVSDR